MPFSPPKPVAILTWPFSKIYGAGIELRNRGFDSGLLPIQKLPRPVISVGNLTVGGTGKTPVVAYLAKYLNQHGLKVAVLTRGYKRETSKTVILNQDNLAQFPFHETGDEARVLVNYVDNGAVVIDHNRFHGGTVAINDFNPDVFILDDGFQHRRLFRELDIVTLDAKLPFGNRQLLPSGPLRESIKNIKRANLLWITRVSQSSFSEEEIKSRMRDIINKPAVFSNHEPIRVIDFASKSKLPIEFLKNRKIIAFAGIANPNSFLETLNKLGANVIKFQNFKDHFMYTPKEIELLANTLNGCNAEILITTEKDAVRFSGEILQHIPNLHVLQVGIQLLDGKEELKKILKNIEFLQ